MTFHKVSKDVANAARAAGTIRALKAEIAEHAARIASLHADLRERTEERDAFREVGDAAKRRLAESIARVDELVGLCGEATSIARAAQADAKGWADDCSRATLLVGKWRGHATLLAQLAHSDARGASAVASLILAMKD